MPMNMSYCRMENTLAALKECEEFLFDRLEADGYEDKARGRLVKLCHSIAEQVPLTEIDSFDKEHNLVHSLSNREWGFPESVLCDSCGHEFTEKELNDLNVEN